MDVWIAHTKDDGIIAASLDVEITKAYAAEQHMEDYFGKPVSWKRHSGSYGETYWIGTYHESAHDLAHVWVEAVLLQTAMPGV